MSICLIGYFVCLFVGLVGASLVENEVDNVSIGPTHNFNLLSSFLLNVFAFDLMSLPLSVISVSLFLSL